MHQDVYGSGNFHSAEYLKIISDVEVFVREFANFDHKRLWIEFEKANKRSATPSPINMLTKLYIVLKVAFRNRCIKFILIFI